jgi:hypothetical protein
LDRIDLERAVARFLPDDFLEATVQSVFLAKQLGSTHCRTEFEYPEIINVEPFYVRGKLEALMRNMAERMATLSASVVNCSGWRHTEITSGPIRLTTHAVDAPCGTVQDAQYRKTLAESQPSFFSPESMIPGAKLYALVLYSPFRGRSKEERAQYCYLPGSVWVAFPEAARKGYAYKVNLYDKFPALVDSLLPKEWDNEARLTYKWQAKQQGVA